MIDLTDLEFRATAPAMPDPGVLQEPVSKGVISKLSRIGGGFRIGIILPAKKFEPHGRRIIARMQMAKLQGAIIRYSQPCFNVGGPGSPTVDGAVAGGMTLPITGATPNYAVVQGQALNVTKSSRTYLYFAGAQVILDASGDGEIPLTTPLRTQLAGGEAVNLGQPCIEGWIEGDNFEWPIDELRMVGLSFTVKERA